MADPFSLVAASAGLAAEGLKLSKTIYTFIKEVRGADDEATRFVEEIKLTSTILEQFSGNLHAMSPDETRYFNPGFFDKIDACVTSCQDIFGQLRTSISAAVPGIIFQTGDPVDFIMRKRDQLQWPFTRLQLISHSKQLRKSKADLHLMVDLMMFTCAQERDKEQRRRRIQHEAVRERQKRIEAQILQTKFMRLNLESKLAEVALEDPIEVFEASNTGASTRKYPMYENGMWRDDAEQTDRLRPSFGSHSHDDFLQPLDGLDRMQHTSLNVPTHAGADARPRRAPGPIHASLNGVGPGLENHIADGQLSDTGPTLETFAETAKVSKGVQVPDSGFPVISDDMTPTEAGAPVQSNSRGVQTVDPASGTRPQDTQTQKPVPDSDARPRHFWERLKSMRAEKKARQSNDRQHWSVDTRVAYEAHIWWVERDEKHDQGATIVTTEPLPYPRDEIVNIIRAFHEKGKSVLSYYDRLGEALRDNINNYLDDMNHLAREPWSIAALIIYPKRARFADIESVTVIFWWRPRDLLAGGPTKDVSKQDGPSSPPRFVKLKDALKREYVIPWETANNLKGIRSVIDQAFTHIEGLEGHVFARRYDILDPKGAIILPSLWDKVIQPGWTISMHMWPIPKEEEPKAEKPTKKTKPASKPSKPSNTERDRPPPYPPAPRESGINTEQATRRSYPTMDDGRDGVNNYQPPPPGSYDSQDGDYTWIRKRKPSRKKQTGGILGWMSGGGIKRRDPSPPSRRIIELADSDTSDDQRVRSQTDKRPLVLVDQSARKAEVWADMQKERNLVNYRRLVEKEGDSIAKLLARGVDQPEDLLKVQEEHMKLRNMMLSQTDPLRNLMHQYTVLDLDKDEDDKRERQYDRLLSTPDPEHSKKLEEIRKEEEARKREEAKEREEVKKQKEVKIQETSTRQQEADKRKDRKRSKRNEDSDDEHLYDDS